MSRILAILACLAAWPVLAQESAEPDEEPGLLDRSTRELLEDFLDRMDPALDDLQREMGEALEAFRDRIGDLNMYHPPEILPNGDIIIRRRQPLDPEPEDPPEDAPEPEPEGDGEVIDL